MVGGISSLLALAILVLVMAGVFAVYQKLSNRTVLLDKIQEKRRAAIRPDSGNVRRADLVTPNREEASKEVQARALIRAGKIKEGAQLLESINLLRPAVAALEQAGQIDEACNLLLKIGRPNRAAAVYSRNGQHVKAGEYYVVAQMYEEAALQFMEAGKEQVQYYVKAARLFQKLGSIHRALDCYMLAGSIDKVVEVAVTAEAWITLARFIDTAEKAQGVFEKLPPDKVKIFVTSLPLETSIIERFGIWATGTKRVDFLGAILPRVVADQGLLVTLWRSMPDEIAAAAVRGIINSMSPKTQNERVFFMRNARALFELGRFVLSAAMYAESGRYAMAAKCWAMYGDFEKCLHFLEKAGETYLADEVRDVLSSADDTEVVSEPGQKTWSSYISSDVHRILSSIDPQSDEGVANSPFTLGKRAG